MTPGAAELALVDRWQRGFPLEPRPFATVGRSVGLDEDSTIATFERLIDNAIITRIGAVVKPHTVGASTLAAMRAPAPRLEAVAAIVSAEPLVNHNYERDHPLNLWFVVAGPDQDAVTQTISRIERATGLGVLDLPLLEAYHLDLGFPLIRAPTRARAKACRSHLPTPPPLAAEGASKASGSGRPWPTADDRKVLAAIEDGLPLTVRPYRAVGEAIDLDEDKVISRIRELAAAGIVTRLGCVVRHRSLGFTANAMAVWDAPDSVVDAVAVRMISHPRVTLCYRRQRRPPDWPYNLFCMVHAKARTEALAIVDDLNAQAGAARFDRAALFSTRCFKQRGAKFSSPDPVANGSLS
jgi:DNA-binding Lrp family transcriptional regulator